MTRRVTFSDGAVHAEWSHVDGQDVGTLVCDLCPRECRMRPGDKGFCFVRENRDGQMALSTYGRSTGFCIDPIEKKPLNHFLPGTAVLSFGTAGCNLGCRFCQNWDISKSREVSRLSEQATPEMIATAAKQLGCRSVAFTYNDPVIWAEYAIDVAAACRQLDIKTVAVTAGYITDQAREPFFAAFDAANVDLKAFSEDFYFQLTASHIQPVLDSLIYLKHETDVWFEITNLIIPDANDSDDELRRMCDWIVERLGVDVPVHFTAFHPDFRMQDRAATPHDTLLRARAVAKEQGVQHAYVGNVNDVANQSTYCPQCHRLLIERNWYELGQYQLARNACQHCGTRISGHFEDSPGDWGRRRQRVPMQQFAPASTAIQIEPRSSKALSMDQPNSPAATESSKWTAEQREAVRKATFELMNAAAQGVPATLSDPSIGGAAETTVDGIFTTLKRGRALRGCCGVLGRPMPLRQALETAAHRTVVDDPRMPPVTGRELSHLHLDISLLHSFEPLPNTAAARRQSIEVGAHGLQISRGKQAGLLLPAVPIEQGWDLDAYLRQICRKAGLPTNAWEDPAANMVRFQATVIESDPQQQPYGDSSVWLQPRELSQLQTHARNNVVAAITGATPSYMVPGCSDGEVQGLVMVVRVGDDVRGEVNRLSLRPGFPLHSTLHSLAQSAANLVRADELEQLQVELVVLDQAAMHGGLRDADLEGVDPRGQGIVVFEQGRFGWAVDADGAPADLLARAASAAHVRNPAAAQVFSFRYHGTTTCPLSGGVVPQPQDVQLARPAAVAGQFYPGDEQSMNGALDELFGSESAVSMDKKTVRAAMAPHAGWRFSGRIAADTLRRIELPRRVLILGPKHTRDGVPSAVAPHAAWALPGGEVAGDRSFAERLARGVSDWQLDAAAHRGEHCIEVELPLLARLRGDVCVTGVALASAGWEQAKQAGADLASVLAAEAEPILLLISSDMNHFATDAENRRLDSLALEALETGDGERLLSVCSQHQISMCGVYPAAIVMHALHAMGQPPRIERLGYATSADVSGDLTRVVGYAGALLY